MLPLKPYMPMYKEFGLIPKTQQAHKVPYAVQTLVIYSLLVPLMKKKQDGTSKVRTEK